jgi:hypothetical protein
MRMTGQAQIVVAANLDVVGPRRPALQGVSPLPKLDLPANVVIVDASAKELRFRRSNELR